MRLIKNQRLTIGRSGLSVVFVFGLLLFLSGCGGYVLNGRVVRSMSSGESGVRFVALGDSDLDRVGVGGVEVMVTRNPSHRMSAELFTVRTRPDGRFSLSLNAFGAGWMEERWRIESFKEGFENAERVLTLPKSSGERQLLILVSPGSADPPHPRNELMDQYEKYR